MLLDNPPEKEAPKPGKFNDPRLVGLLLDRWAKLPAGDPRNLDVSAAAAAFGLSGELQGRLKQARVTNLASLAQALKAAPVLERYNARIAARERDPTGAAPVEPVFVPIGSKEAAEIGRVIGEKLLGAADIG